METIYNVDYFIKKFEAIPEELFTENYLGDLEADGNRPHCANGWCRDINGDLGSGSDIPNVERLNLITLFKSIGIKPQTVYQDNPDFFIVSDVNDGVNPFYRQSTPKQRILAALYDIKKAQQPEVKERIVYVTVDAPVRELQKSELIEN